MDPTATLIELLGMFRLLCYDPDNSLAREKAVKHIHDLSSWIEGGGFAPKVSLLKDSPCLSTEITVKIGG